jgi:hypothetical protein
MDNYYPQYYFTPIMEEYPFFLFLALNKKGLEGNIAGF